MLADGVAVMTPSGELLEANTALAQMLGYESTDHLLAASPAEHPLFSPAERDALRHVAETGASILHRIMALIGCGGERYALTVSVARRCDLLLDLVVTPDSMSAVRELAHVRSLLRRTQCHMAQTERIKAVGSLSGHLAHELNNVFGSVIGRAQLMQMRSTDERVLRECAYIVQAAEQGVAEVKRILHFIHKSRQQVFGPLSVEEVFDDACALLEPEFERFRTQGIPVTIEKNFERHPKVFGYVAELREIIVHVMRNALDAMPEGGRIYASTVYGTTDLSLTIRDAGAGIDSAVQSKMFDPMFTTRGDVHAGMGLTVVKELLRKMKGSITYATQAGDGTSFSVTIPKNDVVPPDSRSLLQSKQSEFDQPFVSKILIVDDDEGVLVSLEKLLASKGFITRALLDGREAVREAKTFQPDVVITDLAMPDMNGWELAREMRLMCPAARIIMTTAYTEMLSDVEMKRTSVDAVMQKPVNVQDLMTAIMSV